MLIRFADDADGHRDVSAHPIPICHRRSGSGLVCAIAALSEPDLDFHHLISSSVTDRQNEWQKDDAAAMPLRSPFNFPPPSRNLNLGTKAHAPTHPFHAEQVERKQKPKKGKHSNTTAIILIAPSSPLAFAAHGRKTKLAMTSANDSIPPALRLRLLLAAYIHPDFLPRPPPPAVNQ